MEVGRIFGRGRKRIYELSGAQSLSKGAPQLPAGGFGQSGQIIITLESPPESLGYGLGEMVLRKRHQ